MKGNLLIAQSGGPSMVINQSLVGVILAARGNPDVGKIFGARHGIQGILDESFVDLRKPSVATLEAVAATPSSALGSVRRKPTEADCAAIFKILQKHGVKWFFYIGGNDSAETVHILGEHAAAAGEDIVCFHVPKTIDNDLRENDHTPGFGSAARFVACALMGDDLDNRALGGVKIDVIMGRHAGFLTAASALARVNPGDGPHLIYLPERPFSPTQFVSDVKAVVKREGRCVVAVSEGIADKKGNLIASKFLPRKLVLRKRVRADTFGYLQRSFPGVASATDQEEARKAGIAAFEAAASGKWRSGSIAIRRKKGRKYAVSFDVVPLKSVAKETRSMPDVFIAENGHDVTDAFIAYARPLVGELPVKAML